MRIAARLVLAISIPLTIFACLAGYDLYQTWLTRSEMANLSHIAQGVSDISKLVHHLQRERGASAVSPVPMSPDLPDTTRAATIRALDPESFDEIYVAIDAHQRAQRVVHDVDRR